MVNKDNQLETADGSITLYSTAYGEAYHSLSGAMSEAFSKYVNPCGIEALARGTSLRLLDIGLGLGYNLLAALHVARNVNARCLIEVVSLEKDPVTLSSSESLPLPHMLMPYANILTSLLRDDAYNDEYLSLSLLRGDARETIISAAGPFDAVFLDPFSPKKNPELWTVEFFRLIYDRMANEAILATYSAATPVRCGLMKAGFRLGPGPGDEMKRGGTLATKNAAIPPFPERDIDRFARSPEATPYHDFTLAMSKEEIFNLRKSLRARIC